MAANQDTLLHTACINGNMKIVKFLVDNGPAIHLHSRTNEFFTYRSGQDRSGQELTFSGFNTKVELRYVILNLVPVFNIE
jgi:ankyrin repeat protein